MYNKSISSFVFPYFFFFIIFSLPSFKKAYLFGYLWS